MSNNKYLLWNKFNSNSILNSINFHLLSSLFSSTVNYTNILLKTANSDHGVILIIVNASYDIDMIAIYVTLLTGSVIFVWFVIRFNISCK